MSTPADAPYKLAQRAADDALRARRRAVRVVHRGKLAAVALALAAGGHAPGSYAAQRLASLLAAMTWAELREHEAAVAFAAKLRDAP